MTAGESLQNNRFRVMRGHRRGLCIRLRRMTRLGINRPARHPTMPLASENSRYRGSSWTGFFPSAPATDRHTKTTPHRSPEIRRPPSGRRPTAHAQRGDRPVCGVSHRARRGLPRASLTHQPPVPHDSVRKRMGAAVYGRRCWGSRRGCGRSGFGYSQRPTGDQPTIGGWVQGVCRGGRLACRDATHQPPWIPPMRTADRYWAASG